MLIIARTTGVQTVDWMVIVTHETYHSVLVGTGKQKGLESLSENQLLWHIVHFASLCCFRTYFYMHLPMCWWLLLYKPTALLAATGGAPCWRRVAWDGLVITPAADERWRRHRWMTSSNTPTNTGIATHGAIIRNSTVPTNGVATWISVVRTTITRNS